MWDASGQVIYTVKIFLLLLDAAVSAFFYVWCTETAERSDCEVQCVYDRWKYIPAKVNGFAELVWGMYVFKSHILSNMGMTPYCKG
jgi:hypothetical protein